GGLLLAAFIALRVNHGYGNFTIGPVLLRPQTVFAFVPLGILGVLLLWWRRWHIRRGNNLPDLSRPRILVWTLVAVVVIAFLLDVREMVTHPSTSAAANSLVQILAFATFLWFVFATQRNSPPP